MKLNTNNVKKMLSVVSKCKENKLLEITQYYELYFHPDGMSISSTDSVNFITVSAPEGACDDEQKVIVKAEQFAKLVNKMTTENIELQVKPDFLQVKGNGTYKCEIFTDEDYPDYEISPDRQYKVSTIDLVHGIQAGKQAKSISAADGVLFSYLLRNEKVIAADSIKVSYTGLKGFDDEILIPPALASLISAIDGDTVTLLINDDKTNIEIVGKNVVIYGALAEGPEEYPDVSFMFEEPYKYTCKLDTQATLQALDRIQLFVGLYDSGMIDLTFTDGALILSTLAGSTEILPYNAKLENFDDDVDYRINGQYLQQLVSSGKGGTVEIHFGDDDSIKVVNGDDQFLLATSDGDDE